MTTFEPLKFSAHDLTVDCYQVSVVKLLYAGTLHELCAGELATAKTKDDETRYPNGKSGAYPAFVGPVKIEWCSRDGTSLSHTLDLNEIFKDHQVLHSEDPAKIFQPRPLLEGQPIIIVELNDRTVSVYMLVTLQLIPSKSHSLRREQREYRTLAYSHTC